MQSPLESRKCLVLFLMALLVLPLKLEAGTLGSIIGYVKGRDGKPIPNAVVTVSGAALMGKQVTRSDAQGFYRITQLPPGNDYRLRFDAVGLYPTQRIVASVHAGMTFRVEDVPLLALGTSLPNFEYYEMSPMLDFGWAGTAMVADAEFLEQVPLPRGHRW